MRIAIIDFGMGNTLSIERALQAAAPKNCTVTLTKDASILAHADKVVFPGQGAAQAVMQSLAHNNLLDAIRKAIAHKPFLGICVGLHMMLTDSEENEGIKGLDLIAGKAVKFSMGHGIKIPHLGWNKVVATRPHHIMRGVSTDACYFYFLHSYYPVIDPNSHNWIYGTTTYHTPFPSLLINKNVVLTQFHPEKSGKIGMKMLENFMSWEP